MDPKDFGLSPRRQLQKIKNNTIAIVISRKSRIIMKDGEKIIEDVDKIHQKEPDMQVVLKTNAPVCSKTRAFLKNHNIDVKNI